MTNFASESVRSTPRRQFQSSLTSERRHPARLARPTSAFASGSHRKWRASPGQFAEEAARSAGPLPAAARPPQWPQPISNPTATGCYANAVLHGVACYLQVCASPPPHGGSALRAPLAASTAGQRASSARLPSVHTSVALRS